MKIAVKIKPCIPGMYLTADGALISPTFYPRQMRGKLQLEQVVIAALLTWNRREVRICSTQQPVRLPAEFRDRTLA